MKIVDRDTFLAMPPGTLFNKGDLYRFGDLRIKAPFSEEVPNTCGFFKSSGLDLSPESILNALRTGASLPARLSASRLDDCIVAEEDEINGGPLFAIWEPTDVQALIDRLKQCLQTVAAAPSAAAAGLADSAFNALPAFQKWRSWKHQNGKWMCAGCREVLDDGPKPPPPFPGGAVHCNGCGYELTRRTAGGQHDPFGWVLAEPEDTPCG